MTQLKLPPENPGRFKTLDLMRFRSKDYVHPISYNDIAVVLLNPP